MHIANTSYEIQQNTQFLSGLVLSMQRVSCPCSCLYCKKPWSIHTKLCSAHVHLEIANTKEVSLFCLSTMSINFSPWNRWRTRSWLIQIRVLVIVVRGRDEGSFVANFDKVEMHVTKQSWRELAVPVADQDCEVKYRRNIIRISMSSKTLN